jgi:NADP-dependent 3-hydroxy acid dehydrogenase YdfG/acyl carrier protein
VPESVLHLCGGLLHLVQALSRAAVTPKLWVITEGAQAVAAQPLHQIDQAPLWGLARTLRAEHPEFDCRALDWDSLSAELPENAVEQVLAELTGQGQEAHIAYRHGTRYVARLARQRLGEATKNQFDGSYLITGGLGGLGLQTAHALADAGARHLILNSRRATPSAAAQAILEQVRQQGVTIDLIAADVADEAACQRLLAECQARAALQQRRLKGIIHGAGVLDDGILLQQNLDRFATVMASKVSGAWHLHQLSQPLALDFFVAFSSAAAVTTEAGQGNYAAANAFLDALMQQRQANGLKSLSINWGAWAAVGLAATLSFQQQGIPSIQPAQGGQVLLELLHDLNAQSNAQVIVQPTHWPTYLAHVGMDTPFYAHFAQEGQSSPAVRPVAGSTPTPMNLRQHLLSLAGAERDARLLAALEEIARKVLGLAAHQPIHSQQGLMNLGMDSLMAVEFRNHLTQRLEQSLPATLLFDYPTLGQLHKFLSAKIFVTDNASPPGVVQQRIEKQPTGNGATATAMENEMTTDEIAQMLAQALTMPSEN